MPQLRAGGPHTRQLQQASVLIAPLSARRSGGWRVSASRAGSRPSPRSLAALCPRWGGGGWPCVSVSVGSASGGQPALAVPVEELGFEGTVRGRRAVTIIE